MFRFGQDMMSRALFRRDVSATPTPGPTALALYDPSTVSTLFQDAAMTVPVAADGDPVGAMMDMSGNNYHLVQAATDRRPVYHTSNGLHWLQFDGANEFLSVSFGASLTTIGVAMASRVTGTSHHNDSIYHLANDDGATLYDFYNRAEVAGEFRNQFRRTGFSVGAGSTDGTNFIGSDHVFTDILTPTGVESRRDGVVTHSSAGTVSLHPTFQFRLMTERYETRSPSGRVYAAALLGSAMQISSVEAYLATRGNVAI